MAEAVLQASDYIMGDFLHPRIAENHPLRPHVLYRITNPGEGVGENVLRDFAGDIAEGEPYLTLAYRPFPTLQPYAETGPIFLCAKACPRAIRGRAWSVMRWYTNWPTPTTVRTATSCPAIRACAIWRDGSAACSPSQGVVPATISSRVRPILMSWNALPNS